MPVVKRRSAGVVVVRNTATGPRVLVLRAYRNWDFPKGLVEAGEAPLAAAIRETAEETGLRDLDFRWGEDYCETPPYAGGKVARYYLAESKAGEPALPVAPWLGRPEHHEWRWAGFEAIDGLLVPRLQAVWGWAQVRLAGSLAK